MSHFHQGHNVDDEGAAELIPVGEEDYAQSDDTPAGYEGDGRLMATRDGVLGKPNAELRAIWQQYYMDTSGSGNVLLSDHSLRRGLSGLTAAPVEEVAFTYEKGERLDVYDDKATCIDVAIHYITGADFAEVIRQENEGVMRGAPVKKSPTWKAATAGDLLKEIEATEELEFDFKDMTPHILQQRRNRQGKQAANNGAESKSKVNIKSERVHIVNADSPKQHFDLECLCIELHGNSLMNLIYNFRTLLLEKGTKARRNANEIIQILETMVEDARRLLSWSPIIGRIAHRLAIHKSTYTRYGCDNGKAFWTLATSRGIALTVKHSVSYLSELKASNSKLAFGSIKPKVMQIVVLLLSLLNDSDLKQLENMLEDQYQLKADRKSMELTIMKVLTLSSVGAPLFLSSLLSSFDGGRCDTQKFKEKSQRVIAWDSFVSAITREGWILPGSLIKKRLRDDKTSKTKEQSSWKVKWDEYTDTEIFDHLQYNGEKKEVNDIPPLKLQCKDFEIEEVLADFRDGKKYVVAFKDLEGITLASPGTYQLSDPESGEKKDLRVDTEDQFFELKDLWNSIRKLCVSVSEHAPRGEMQRSWKVGNALTRVKRSVLDGKARPARAPPTCSRIAGRRAKNTTTIETSASGQCQEIAVCWFLEGGKITKAEMLEGVLEDWNTLDKTVKELKSFSVSTRRKVAQGKDRVKGSQAATEETKLLDMLDRELERINQELLKMNEKRRQLSQEPDKDDEPIARVHFPNPVHYKQDMPWLCFRMNLDREGAGLEVWADLYKVCEPPRWRASMGEVSIQHLNKRRTLGVVPLDPVPESQRKREITKHDKVLLLGGLVVVINRKERVVNYLKLTSLDIIKDDDESGRSEDESEDEKLNPMIKLL